MRIGLYIFNNNSNKSNLVLLKEILKNDKENIKSIFINKKVRIIQDKPQKVAN